MAPAVTVLANVGDAAAGKVQHLSAGSRNSWRTGVTYRRQAALIRLDRYPLPPIPAAEAVAWLVEVTVNSHDRDNVAGFGQVAARLRSGATLGAALTSVAAYRSRAVMECSDVADTRIGLLMRIALCSDADLLARWCNDADVWVRQEAAANPACPDYGRAVVALRAE